MSDIELVVRLDEELYGYVKRYYNVSSTLALRDIDMCMNAIINGIPLPKSHGRLKDVDNLDTTTITTDDYSANEVLDIVLKEDIDDADTIIEASKEVIEDGNK